MKKVLGRSVMVVGLGAMVLLSGCGKGELQEAPGEFSGSHVATSSIHLGGGGISTLESDVHALPKALPSTGLKKYTLVYTADTSVKTLEESLRPMSREMFLLYADALVRGNSTEINEWLEDKDLSYANANSSLQSMMSSLADGVGNCTDVYLLKEAIKKDAGSEKFTVASEKTNKGVWVTYALSDTYQEEYGVSPKVSFYFASNGGSYTFTKFSSTSL
jgi:hypothetical protein